MCHKYLNQLNQRVIVFRAIVADLTVTFSDALGPSRGATGNILTVCLGSGSLGL